jgi:hypothetical protein
MFLFDSFLLFLLGIIYLLTTDDNLNMRSILVIIKIHFLQALSYLVYLFLI